MTRLVRCLLVNRDEDTAAVLYVLIRTLWLHQRIAEDVCFVLRVSS